MAAYAALVSLMGITEQVQTHPRHSFSLDTKQIESLQEKVGFLLEFMEGYSHGDSEEAEALESQIASAAYEAEDVIESHVVDQIHAGSTLNGKTSSCFLVDLQKVIEDMDSIKKMAMKVKAQKGFRDQRPTYSKPATSSAPPTTGKNTMVEFDDEMSQLANMLTGPQSSLQIIPIVGMGGIGKTTLARNIYEKLLNSRYFDICVWVTISQEYSEREILLKLLSNERYYIRVSVDELGVSLHKRLFRRRYLIILDDMWSIEVWDKIKNFFPDDGNSSSRVVLTTRLSNVADHCSSSCFRMNFLDEHKSWNLFCDKAFPQEGCPRELEEIGKKIVKKCRGLPLSIVVIGGHLGKSLRTQENWENVANDINSILCSEEDEQCLKILSLSYSHLPIHLKPCFLYMGIFWEDDEIHVSRLIKLWVAEGFLKPNKAQSLEEDKAQTLEEVAEGHLTDLVDRNLILVRRWGRNGKIKTCGIHDLLRELCLRVAEKEKFLCVMKWRDTPRPINGERRVVIHESIPEEYYYPRVFHALKSAPLVRSLICNRGQPLFDIKLLKVLNSVRVLNKDEIAVGFLETCLQQVNLRYLDCRFFLPPVHRQLRVVFSLPPLYLSLSISLLWNLQTLIISRPGYDIVAPSEIWEMSQLRHLKVSGLRLPDDPPNDRINQQDDFVVLRDLQTLMYIKDLKLSEEVCKRIPNIKKLHIRFGDFPRECEASSYYCLHNLGCFHKLESLNCTFTYSRNFRDSLRQNRTFPSSLKKLSLNNCKLHWEDLTVIGSLPHLEVLKLHSASVVGSEWNPVEGEFRHLKFLYIIGCIDLIIWTADSSHFPVLELLFLEGLKKLDEIPSGIGEIPTLQSVHLHSCSEAAAISAMKILVEQESLGNEGLQLEVQFYLKEEEESFREKVEAEGLTSNNLLLVPAHISRFVGRQT